MKQDEYELVARREGRLPLGGAGALPGKGSRDRKVLGDYSGALSYGSTAKYLNITALLLNILLVILIVVLVATGTITFARYINQQYTDQTYFGSN
ncbi:PREDICTED: dispanin subfamily A member 2b-like [Chaetura pelagica]|uniref:dispanin subfamily A member 2b-like n=1 Tax=Chaetura pelagica TaxID=8897 RepID=UPI000523CA0B|nr:PREDICTED: dispanin subfamily A member 2b-like [Chaetura pelagica]